VQMGLRSGVTALRCSFRLVCCLSRGSLCLCFGCVVGCKRSKLSLSERRRRQSGGDDDSRKRRRRSARENIPLGGPSSFTLALLDPLLTPASPSHDAVKALFNPVLRPSLHLIHFRSSHPSPPQHSQQETVPYSKPQPWRSQHLKTQPPPLLLQQKTKCPCSRPPPRAAAAAATATAPGKSNMARIRPLPGPPPLLPTPRLRAARP